MILRLEIGLIFGSSALAEKNQQQSNKFYNPSYMSSQPAEIITLSEPIFKKIDSCSIKSDTSRPLVKN